LVPTNQQFGVVGFLDDNENNYKAYNFRVPFLCTSKAHEVSAVVLCVMGIAKVLHRRPLVSGFIDKDAKFATPIY
jgi:hypothetical protein